MRTRYKVAAVQVETTPETPTKEALAEKAVRLIEQTCEEWGVSAVCLNEWFNWEIPDKNTKRAEMDAVAEPIPGPTTERLSKVAKKYGIYLVGGTILEKREGRFYDSSPVIGPDGNLLGVARLSRLPDTLIKYYVGAGLSAGDLNNRTYETEIGQIGVIVDWEISNREVWDYVKAKSQIIFIPLNWATRAANTFWKLLPVYGSSCYVVAANRAGLRRGVAEVGDLQYDGRSIIVNPGGNIIAATSTATFRAWENVAAAMVDLSLTKVTGRDLPKAR